MIYSILYNNNTIILVTGWLLPLKKYKFMLCNTHSDT